MAVSALEESRRERHAIIIIRVEIIFNGKVVCHATQI